MIYTVLYKGISFGDLQDPTGPYRVRAVTSSRVEELVKVMGHDKSLSSSLTVMDVGEGKYMVIDGNHRLMAMRAIRSKYGDDRFQTIPCMVHATMDPIDALSIGYNKNISAQDVLGMSDYDKVVLIRKVKDDMPEDEEKNTLQRIYKLLNVQEVW